MSVNTPQVRGTGDRRFRAGQRRVGGDGRRGVAGHLDLRHDHDVALARVLDHVADLLLGVEPAAAAAVGFGAPGADAGELRVLAYLDAPALVVGQMPVQHVELVARQQVDLLLHQRHRDEVP